MCIFISIFPITFYYLLNVEFNHVMEGDKLLCMIRWGGGGVSEGADWIPNQVQRGLDA